ncbi:hypothetical protein ES288_A02G040200v1 [Gossypium darwinii]|uniref:Bifunctional inhibitor/plant lipid transfer protein/seed storage helical domain-containing protein n=1 Tax=Gossypium darwinii TaxID=34276 RepID=A0A5D2H9W9_GOSDA|nr:hypothetical protein ES288_A02G040200v1 [Gossypium darwinii]
MALCKPYSRLVLALAMALVAATVPVYGQRTINTPCTPSALNIFTPCMNLLTNSSANGTSPTADCCNSLKTLTSSGMDCLCLIVTGSVPFRLPINRTLAISLPRACSMPGVPLQCKASVGAPVPAPGPISLAPTLSPGTSPTLSPEGSIVPEPTGPAEAPESNTTRTATTGSRPVLNPTASAADRSYSFSPSLVLLTLGFAVFKYY